MEERCRESNRKFIETKTQQKYVNKGRRRIGGSVMVR